MGDDRVGITTKRQRGGYRIFGYHLNRFGNCNVIPGDINLAMSCDQSLFLTDNRQIAATLHRNGESTFGTGCYRAIFRVVVNGDGNICYGQPNRVLNQAGDECKPPGLVFVNRGIRRHQIFILRPEGPLWLG